MSLDDWLNNRWLHRHETSAEEIQALLHSAEEDIRSAEIEGIAAGWRLNMGYTAALRYARAALYVVIGRHVSASTNGLSIRWLIPFPLLRPTLLSCCTRSERCVM